MAMYEDKIEETKRTIDGFNKILNKLPNDPVCRLSRLQMELTEIDKRIEATSGRLSEAQEKVKILSDQCHQKTIEAIIQDPDQKYVVRPAEDVELLKDTKAAVEDMGLILEALQIKRQRFQDELIKARREVQKIEARKLAAKVPELVNAYNENIRRASDAAFQIKIIREGVFLRDKSELASVPDIAELCLQLPNQFTLAGFLKPGHLIILQCPDSPKDRAAILEKLLK